jgi:hypothetical protein
MTLQTPHLVMLISFNSPLVVIAIQVGSELDGA